MFRTGLISVLLFVFALPTFLLCPVYVQAAEPTPWLELHSAHFTVITDAGDKKGREVALRFEQMRSVFGVLLGKERLNMALPLTILALKDDKSYYQLAPLFHGQPTTIPGFFLPGDDQNFIVLNLFEEESWRAVAHDFAHMFLNCNYPPAQAWFDEGLAEYFASIRVDNKEVNIGADPELTASVTQDLLENQQETNPPQSLTELLGAKIWLSMADLFSMKQDTALYSEGTHHTLFYAQSWMVMHYLINQKKLPETGVYFGLVLNQQMPVDEAIQKAYGMSSAQFEQAVKDYFKSLTTLQNALLAARDKNPTAGDPEATPQPYHFSAAVGPDSMSIVARPIPETDARAIYAGVQVRVPERRESGLKELQKLATTQPTAAIAQQQKKWRVHEKAEEGDDPDDKTLPAAIGNEVAHRALAWDHIEHKEFDAAGTEIMAAASLSPRDIWLRYYLSVLKYRFAQTKQAEIQGLANMMQDLRAVLEWYPEFAEAYDLLAVARMQGGGSIAAMEAAHAAIQLNPRDEIYVFHEAQIYIEGKKWEAAQALLEHLKMSSNSQMAARSREKLEQIATERKYGIPVASGATAPKLAPQKSPFDVLEQDEAKREAEEKSPQVNVGDTRATKFLKGRLVSVDCSQTPVAILRIASGNTTLKLRASDYKTLVLVGADEFSCQWSDRPITANYKPGGAVDGDLVSLEIR
jgi:hypothetical protein